MTAALCVLSEVVCLLGVLCKEFLLCHIVISSCFKVCLVSGSS